MCSEFQSSGFKFQITTCSLNETHILGQQTGIWVKNGMVIALTGDLGSGKTSFVQGLAKGLDVPDEYYITSPTFTLINEYPGRCPLFHIDLYRLNDPVDVEDIGLYDILHGEGIVAVEWADRLYKNFLSDYMGVHLEILSDESRKIEITANGESGISLIRKLFSSALRHNPEIVLGL